MPQRRLLCQSHIVRMLALASGRRQGREDEWLSSSVEGSKPKPFDGASNISSSSFIATFHAEADAVRACRLARGSLWARVLGPGRGLGEGSKSRPGEHPSLFLSKVLGYVHQELHYLLLCSQNELKNHIIPYIISSEIICQHFEKYTPEQNTLYKCTASCPDNSNMKLPKFHIDIYGEGGMASEVIVIVCQGVRILSSENRHQMYYTGH